MVGRIEDTSYVDEAGRTRWRLNDRVAAQLQRMADLLAVGGETPAFAGHYRRLAVTVSRLEESLETLRHEGRLRRLPGVGPTLRGLLMELVDTGTSATWSQGRAPIPASVEDLLEIPGLGAKTVRVLYRELGIDGLPALRRAVDEGWLQTVPGFGPKLVTRLRRHLEARERGEV